MGERIKAARNEAGYSQKRLARVMGVSFQAVQKWEKGNTRPRHERLRSLSLALNKPLSYFTGPGYFGDQSEEPPEVDQPPQEDVIGSRSELLHMTERVLDSNSFYSEALAFNIRAFYKAVIDAPDCCGGKLNLENHKKKQIF